MKPALPALAIVAVLSGCSDAGFERMVHQRSVRPLRETPEFDDRIAMRDPPEGTIPRSRPGGSEEMVTGKESGIFLATIPIDVELSRGQDRYRTFCAVCHGEYADGVSDVARVMQLRPPPSLVTSPIAAYPPGRIFTVISAGYGLMPAYDAAMSPRDRWAVVAYVDALRQEARTWVE